MGWVSDSLKIGSAPAGTGESRTGKGQMSGQRETSNVLTYSFKHLLYARQSHPDDMELTVGFSPAPQGRHSVEKTDSDQAAGDDSSESSEQQRPHGLTLQGRRPMTTAEFPFSCPQLWTCAKDPSCCPSLIRKQKSQGSGAYRGEYMPE